MRVENEKGEVYHISWNMQTELSWIAQCEGVLLEVILHNWAFLLGEKMGGGVQVPPILVLGRYF